MMRTISTLLACIFLISCAPFPNSINPNVVSMHTYNNLNCKEISIELRKIEVEEKRLVSKQKSRAINDVVFFHVGMWLFWPAWIVWPIVANCNKNKKDEIAQLRGEYEALKDAQIAKNCLIPSQ